MRVGVDYDGVIHDYADGWNGLSPTGKPLPGALEFILWLKSKGMTPVIITARLRPDANDGGAFGVRKWLNDYGFPDDLLVTGTKIPCCIYIDDRGYRFSGDFEAIKALLSDGIDPGTWQHPKGEVPHHSLGDDTACQIKE